MGRDSTRTDEPRRLRRLLRVVVGVGVCALAVIGLVHLVAPAPAQVGSFRTVQGRLDYLDAYQRTLAQMPEPTTVGDVRTRFGTVRVYEWSTAANRAERPVVLLPGRTSGAPMWRENLPGLIGQRRVIALDALGDAGLSAQSVPLTSMDDQTDWLDDVLADVSPEAAVHLVGHSFGGATAAAYARTHPERVATLTLLEPVFTLGSPPASIYLWSTILLLPTPQSWRETAMREIGGDDASEDDLDDPLVDMIDIGARQYSAHLPTPTVLTADQLAELTMPVYVGLGELSRMAGGTAAEDAARTHLPDATTRVWPDTTHSLPMQVPEALDAELTAFWAAADRD